MDIISDLNLHLDLENYEGPLDLLLELIKEHKMDIFDIDLAALATAYVAFINKIKYTNLDLASEYLVMAATLIQLKARMLLESPLEEKKVKKEQRDLLDQLIEYHKFKTVAIKLRNFEEARTNIFIKSSDDYKQYQVEVDETKLDGSSDAISLIIALRKMFERVNAMKLRETTIDTFNLSPADRRNEIIHILKTKEDIKFEDIFSVPSLNHFVITVLTVLDMAKKEEIILHQENQFDEIQISKGVLHD